MKRNDKNRLHHASPRVVFFPFSFFFFCFFSKVDSIFRPPASLIVAEHDRTTGDISAATAVIAGTYLLKWERVIVIDYVTNRAYLSLSFLFFPSFFNSKIACSIVHCRYKVWKYRRKRFFKYNLFFFFFCLRQITFSIDVRNPRHSFDVVF